MLPISHYAEMSKKKVTPSVLYRGLPKFAEIVGLIVQFFTQFCVQANCTVKLSGEWATWKEVNARYWESSDRGPKVRKSGVVCWLEESIFEFFLAIFLFFWYSFFSHRDSCVKCWSVFCYGDRTLKVLEHFILAKPRARHAGAFCHVTCTHVYDSS